MSEETKTKEIALKIIDSASPQENAALKEWAEDLLNLRASSLSASRKAQQAIVITKNKKIIFPIIKTIFKHTKKTIWDDRGTKSRLGIIGIAAGMTLFSGQSAGIAALGGAIGVPLWIVFGAGGAFAGVFIEECHRKQNKNAVRYEVLDASKDE